MIIDAVMKNNVIYSTIICGDDSTIRAVSKWSYKELLKLQSSFQWPRTLKGLKNRKKDSFRWLYLNINFCLSHHTEYRSFSARLFWYCLWLKVYYGAWIKIGTSLWVAVGNDFFCNLIPPMLGVLVADDLDGCWFYFIIFLRLSLVPDLVLLLSLRSFSCWYS